MQCIAESSESSSSEESGKMKSKLRHLFAGQESVLRDHLTMRTVSGRFGGMIIVDIGAVIIIIVVVMMATEAAVRSEG